MASGYTGLHLTDGTTTIDLNNGTSYFLQGGGWSPKIAKQSLSPVGNRCPYENVLETITISITAGTISLALANLDSIVAMLNQAKQYANNANVSPVRLTVDVQGYIGSPWEALIIDADVILPQDWADNLPNKSIEDIQLRILRRGLWTRDSVASTTSSATSNGKIASVSLTNLSPQAYATEVLITSSADEFQGGNYYNHPGYIAMTGTSGNIAWGVGNVNVNDAANKPAGHATNVSSFTNLSACVINATSGFTPAFNNSTAKRVAVLGAFKTTVTSAPVRVAIKDATGNTIIDSATFNIHDSTTDTITFCGVLNWNSNATFLEFVALAASTVTFDLVWLVDISDPYTSLMRFDDLSVYQTLQAMRSYRVYNPANALAPTLQAKPNAGTYADFPFSGNAWMPAYAPSSSLYLARMARGSNGLYWQPVDGATAAMTSTFKVTEIEGSLVPR